jgi:translation initiation factor IF-2
MPEKTKFNYRLSKATKEFNVGKDTIVEFLAKKGLQVNPAPNTKLTAEMYMLLVNEFQGEKDVKNEAKKLGNLSYKGGSVSIESDSYTSAVANPTKEEVKEIEKRRKRKEKEHKFNASSI